MRIFTYALLLLGIVFIVPAHAARTGRPPAVVSAGGSSDPVSPS